LPGLLIWDNRNVCLSFDDTVEWFALFDLPMVEVLYRGPWDEKIVRALHDPRDDGTHEGYVVRLAREFPYGEFSRSVGKYVRANHVTTDRHWMRGRRIEPNGLRPTVAG
jgi:hypothetical protein